MTKNPLSILLALIRAILLILLMIIMLAGHFVSLLFVKESPEKSFRLRRNYAKIAVPLLGIKVKIRGKMDDRPCLYVSNHRSFSDPLIQALCIDAYIIAKAEVADLPILSAGAKATGIVYVKRESSASRVKARNAIPDTVLSGYNILVYPEGTTGVEITSSSFKIGGFKAAAQHHFPVVPVAIEYAEEIDKWDIPSLAQQYMRQYGKWRTDVKVDIGEAIVSEDHKLINDYCKRFIDDSILRIISEWPEKKTTI